MQKHRPQNFTKMLLKIFVASLLILGTVSDVQGRKVKRLRKHRDVVHTIYTHHGDKFDCYPTHKQPSMRHPLLKDHEIQTTRPMFHVDQFIQLDKEGESKHKHKRGDKRGVSIDVGFKEHSCPEGTVPILRPKRDHHAKFNYSTDIYYPQEPNSRVAFFQSNEGEYYGIGGRLNLWNYPLQQLQHSDMKLILTRLQDVLEVGWTINPTLFGDSKTRLYGRWTSTMFQGTGCFNALCPGFVQISRECPLGIVLEPVSDWERTQYMLNMVVGKDIHTGNWWLVTGEKMDRVIGYWPKDIFRSMSDSAQLVSWGAEANKGPLADAPQPYLGSGFPVTRKFKNSAWIGDLALVNDHNGVIDALTVTRLHPVVTNDKCANVMVQPGLTGIYTAGFYVGGDNQC